MESDEAVVNTLTGGYVDTYYDVQWPVGPLNIFPYGYICALEFYINYEATLTTELTRGIKQSFLDTGVTGDWIGDTYVAGQVKTDVGTQLFNNSGISVIDDDYASLLATYIAIIANKESYVNPSDAGRAYSFRVSTDSLGAWDYIWNDSFTASKVPEVQITDFSMQDVNNYGGFVDWTEIAASTEQWTLDSTQDVYNFTSLQRITTHTDKDGGDVTYRKSLIVDNEEFTLDLQDPEFYHDRYPRYYKVGGKTIFLGSQHAAGDDLFNYVICRPWRTSDRCLSNVTFAESDVGWHKLTIGDKTYNCNGQFRLLRITTL